MASPIFSFPNPVNDVAARAVASGVVIMAIVAITTKQMWITIPLAYGFVARTLSGPRFSPLGRIASQVVALHLPRFSKLVPGPPKRFAQAIGSTFTVTALMLWLAGETTASRVLLVCLSVPAILEAGLGYCAGCKMFALLMRAGIIPEEICEECADIYSAKAQQRRKARTPPVSLTSQSDASRRNKNLLD